jgi:hypothetical protein
MDAYHQHRPSDLHLELRRWLARNRGWYLRQAQPDSDVAISWTPAYRYASSDEVAAAIVDDPALRQALIFLSSPPGQVIEQAIAQLWLHPWQAELLTDGVTRAWKIILDQSRPVWQRADVLAGTGVALAVIGVAIWASRHAA